MIFCVNLFIFVRIGLWFLFLKFLIDNKDMKVWVVNLVFFFGIFLMCIVLLSVFFSILYILFLVFFNCFNCFLDNDSFVFFIKFFILIFIVVCK